MEFRLLERNNVCEMEGCCLTRGRERLLRDAGSYPCFFRAFDYFNRHGAQRYDCTYKLHMHKRYDGQRNNFVVLTKKDMCRILNSVKRIIPFKYHFEDTEDDHILHMTLEGTGAQHKGLLMLSRMLFEYPHNVCAKDALKLRELKRVNRTDFSKMTLISLYILCISGYDFSQDECIIQTNTPTLISGSELKRELRNIERLQVSHIIPAKQYRFRRLRRLRSTEEITDEEKLHTRLLAYAANLRSNLNA